MTIPIAAEIPFLVRLGRFVRFSHTVFAMPFALMAMLVAGHGRVAWPVFGWILLCLTSARTAAMCFNRLADWQIDQENPRTADRHRLIRREQGWVLLGGSAALFVFGSYELNRLCFAFSLPVLALVLFYSVTKRFTAYSHLFLGLALGAAPVGAWIAVRGEMADPAPYLLAAAVLCWVFGFDLIYSTLDAEFDRRKGLFSFPAVYGVPAALRLAFALHWGAAAGFLAFGWLAGLGLSYWVACAVVIVVLFWQHRIANPADAGSINRAFFNVNALVSVGLLLGTGLDLWLRHGL